MSHNNAKESIRIHPQAIYFQDKDSSHMKVNLQFQQESILHQHHPLHELMHQFSIRTLHIQSQNQFRSKFQLDNDLHNHHRQNFPAGVSLQIEFREGISPLQVTPNIVTRLEGMKLLGCTAISTSRLPQSPFLLSPTTILLNIPKEPGGLCGSTWYQMISMLTPCRFHAGIWGSGPSPALLLGILRNQSQDRSVSIRLTMEERNVTLELGVEYTMMNLPLERISSSSSTTTTNPPAQYGMKLSSLLLGTKDQDTFVLDGYEEHLNSNYIQACPLMESSTIETILSPMEISWLGIANTNAKTLDANTKTTLAFQDSPHVISQYQDRFSITHDLRQINNVAKISMHDYFFTISSPPRDSNPPLLDPNNHTFLLPTSSSQPQSADSWEISRAIKPYKGMSPTTGRLYTQVENHHGCSSTLLLHDLYPTRLLQPQFHTLQFFLQTKDKDSPQLFVPPNFQILTPEENMSIATLFLNTTLPPYSSLSLSIEYETHFLSVESFPANPHRGFDIPPSYAHLSSLCSSSPTSQNPTTILYSPSLILLPPVPDMSMPFNVISLTCTVYAFLVGTLMNLLIKRSTEYVKNRYERKTPETKWDRLRNKLQMVPMNIMKVVKKFQRRENRNKEKEEHGKQD